MSQLRDAVKLYLKFQTAAPKANNWVKLCEAIECMQCWEHLCGMGW